MPLFSHGVAYPLEYYRKRPGKDARTLEKPTTYGFVTVQGFKVQRFSLQRALRRINPSHWVRCTGW